MYCDKCGKTNQEGAAFCLECGADLGVSRIPSPTPPAGPVKKKRKYIKVFGICAAIFLGLTGILYVIGMLVQKNDISLGNTVVLLQAQVPTEGKTITVDSASVLNGMSITVGKGSYEGTVDFTISETDITRYDMGKYFEPITPLITIDNGHTFAKVPMKLSIPINKLPEEFAMAFFYDRETGKLEALPTNVLTIDRIEVYTSHFSDIVVSKINKAELEKMAFNPKQKIDTGFEPGKDDWQFVNYGSYLAPKGHCGGQAISMSWYYSQKHNAAKEPRLYGRFDNNGSSAKTPDFQFDDASAYRFASVIQKNTDWKAVNSFLNFSDKAEDDMLTFNSFVYAMLLTKEPQLMAIFESGKNKKDGHAVLVYKIEGGKFFIADPNYPGKKDRFVEAKEEIFEYEDFSDTASTVYMKYFLFSSYSSGAKADDIAQKGEVDYIFFHFIGQSAVVDYKMIETQYAMMLNGKAGNDDMPSITMAYLSAVDEKDEAKLEFTPVDGTLVLEEGFDKNYPAALKGKVTLQVNTGKPNFTFTVYTGLKEPVELEQKYKSGADGKVLISIPLKSGDNYIGILCEGLAPGTAKETYVDFERVKVVYDGKPAEETSAETTSPKTTAAQTVPATTKPIATGPRVLAGGIGRRDLSIGTPVFVALPAGLYPAGKADRIAFRCETQTPFEKETKTPPEFVVTYEETNDFFNRKLTITVYRDRPGDSMEVVGRNIESDWINVDAQEWKLEPDKIVGYVNLVDGVNITVKTSLVQTPGSTTGNFFFIDIIAD
jgi:hypothetical protein